jgi:hypothetical protein
LLSLFAQCKIRWIAQICLAWGHSFARGFARLILDRVRDNLDQAPGSRNFRVLDTRLRMPNKWHMCKEGKAGNKKRQRRGLLVFSELPCLPSAGSRPGCFHTSLGCEPRSFIRVSLGCSIIRKNVRKDNPTPAYSPVSDRRRPTALVEVHWARRVQAPMPQLADPTYRRTT